MCDDRVTVDPNVRFGRPAVCGISTEAIAEQAESGASEDEIARDYGISIAAVQAALVYEGVRAELTEMSPAEYEAAKGKALASLGLTYEQLADQAREGEFSTPQARKLWRAIGD